MEFSLHICPKPKVTNKEFFFFLVCLTGKLYKRKAQITKCKEKES